jgi:DNA-binding CsgD family transcriptional regulator
LVEKRSPDANRFRRGGVPWKHSQSRYRREFVLGSDFFPDENLPATDFYQEFMAPQGLAPEAPMTHIMSSSRGRPASTIIIFRRLGCRPLLPDDLALCNNLVPHLARAYRIHARLHNEQEQGHALAEVVDRFPMGVMLLDPQQRCVSANASADRILEGHAVPGPGCSQPGVSDQCRRARLDEAIRDAAANATEAGRRGRVIAVEGSPGRSPLAMMVAPLRASEGASSDDAVVVVFMADPNAGATSQEVLGELYSLTTAESALVGHLVAGRSLKESAQLRGIRTGTARGYLKNVYRKTGTRSQQQLVSLILTGVGRLDTSDPRRAASGGP